MAEVPTSMPRNVMTNSRELVGFQRRRIILRAMGGRLLGILVAIWWAAWSCIIVPAHTRGAVGIDGTLARTTTGERVAMFLSSVQGCCQPKPSPDGKIPPRSNAGSCAICLMVANTGTTPALPLIVPALCESRFEFVPEAAQLCSGEFVPVYLGRGPPAIAVS